MSRSLLVVLVFALAPVLALCRESSPLARGRPPVGSTASATPPHVSVPLASPAAAPKPLPRPTVFALLADNRLMAVDPRSGAVLSEQPLTIPATTERFAGKRLALSPDGSHLYALAVGNWHGSDVVVSIDAATGVVQRSTAVQQSGDKYVGLAVGPRTGRVFVFGSDEQGRHLQVRVYSPDLEQEVATWSGGPVGNLLFRGVLAPDERSLFVAYHAMGIQEYELTADGLLECRSDAQYCFRSHGDFVLEKDRLVADAGEGALIEYSLDGDKLGTLETGLPGNHMVALSLSPATDQLYMLGACNYAGGLSVLNLGSGSGVLPLPTVLFPSRRLLGTPTEGPTVCGKTLTVGQSLLVVGQVAGESSDPHAAGALLFIDARARRITSTVRTPSEPVDVLVVP